MFVGNILICRKVSGSLVLRTYCVWKAILGTGMKQIKCIRDCFPRLKKEHSQIED